MSDTSVISETLVVLAGTLIDGTGGAPRQNVALTIKDGIITNVGSLDSVPRGATVLDLREQTVLPGLINMHAHTMLPGDGTPFADWMELSDELLLLKAHANSMTALESGVTTIRDCGGRGQIMFRLREAIRMGIVDGPRFVLCGRALTITGGHCHYFGAEADGPEEMRHSARQLLKEGADFIKIMASGGGTVGTYSQFPSFDGEELKAAIHEAHKIRKLASCHCIATESVPLALDAGTDHIEHCMFMAPDTSIKYDEEIAHRVAEEGVYVTATVQTLAELPEAMQARLDRHETTPEDDQFIDRKNKMTSSHLAVINGLRESGVSIVAGNDAGWNATGFGDFYKELGHLVAAGFSPLEAIYAATGRAADACQLSGVIGTLAAGCQADLLAVHGDPLTDITALGHPAMVVQQGWPVVDKR